MTTNDPIKADRRSTQRLHRRTYFAELKANELYNLVLDRFGEDDQRTKAAFNFLGWAHELKGMLDPVNPKASAQSTEAP